MDDVFDQNDMERFVNREFLPFVRTFERHVDDDAKFQEKISDAIHRVSTAIETQVSSQAATAKIQRELIDSKWVRITVGALVFSGFFGPFVTVAIFVWQMTHSAVATLAH